MEDCAVDLYVLERSLQSAHSAMHDLNNTILDGYLEFHMKKKIQEKGVEVLNKLKEVRARGRKRVMIGWSLQIKMIEMVCFADLW